MLRKATLVLACVTAFGVYASESGDLLEKCYVSNPNSTGTITVPAEDTLETAEALFAARGANVNNAINSAKMFARLAETVSSNLARATLLIKQSSAVYYVGTDKADAKDKKACHEAGALVATDAIKALGGAEVKVEGTEDEKDLLALSYYWYGANLGKWGEANGPVNSLFKWPKLNKSMTNVINLGKDAIVFFGADRILGRAYYKLPGSYGGKDRAEKHLKKAFDNTRLCTAENVCENVSVYGLNNIYYAELLIAKDKVAEAKAILTNFVAKDPNTLLPSRIPETKKEIEEAKKKLADLE